MMRRPTRIRILLGVAAAAAAATAAALTSPSIIPDPPAPRPGPARPAALAPRQAGSGLILVRLLRGRMVPSDQEVSITTIFSERSFSVLADADLAGGSEQDLKDHVKEIFSLKEVTSLGSSVVALSGGSAVLDDDGRRVEIRIIGESVGGRAVRLVVSQVHDGREVVATSVIARQGKTVVLAGPPLPSPLGRRGAEISFLCLTPIAGPAPPLWRELI